MMPQHPTSSTPSSRPSSSKPSRDSRPRKTVHLVRHGQSIHNAHIYRASGADLNDARYIDSPLTSRGIEQAKALVPVMNSLNPDLIVCSPFTRATQTMLYAAGHMTKPIIVTPLCIERMAYACDIGSPVSDLHKRFPALDYSLVRPPNCWWWTPAVPSNQAQTLTMLRRHAPGSNTNIEPGPVFKARAVAFRDWLKTRDETNIAVFAHGKFLREFVGGSEYFANCQVKTVKI